MHRRMRAALGPCKDQRAQRASSTVRNRSRIYVQVRGWLLAVWHLHASPGVAAAARRSARYVAGGFESPLAWLALTPPLRWQRIRAIILRPLKRSERVHCRRIDIVVAIKT